MALRNEEIRRQTGSFTQEDPIGIGGGLNLYGFGAGDPITFSDPFGLCPDKAKEGVFCLDLFIQANWVFPGLKGDGRTFNPNATAGQSRAQIVIDPGAGTESHTISRSCTPLYCRKPLGPSKNRIRSERADDGSFTLQVNLVNSAFFGAGPDIDGSVSFTPDGKGGWVTHGDLTAFPSNALYQQVNGRWVPVKPNHTETNPGDLRDGHGRDRW